MRQSSWIVPVMALTIAVAPACATKKFVRTSVGEVNTKVDSVSKTVEETQQRTTQNEGRIGEVDAKAENAAKSAAAAGTAASAAAAAAKEANTKAAAVDTRVAEVEKSAKRLILEVTLTEDQGNFKPANAELPIEMKNRIDQVVGQLTSDPKNAYIEIEGHTDGTGDAASNERLGLQRAESVKRYIYEAHKVPLHRINVISYGETKPVAENKTRDGRAQNRRVVIRILT